MQKYAFLINNSLALLSYYMSQQPYKVDTVISIFQRKLMYRGVRIIFSIKNNAGT